MQLLLVISFYGRNKCKRYTSIQGVELLLLTCRLVTEKVFATLYVPFNDLHVTVYAVLLPKNREVRFTIHMFINGSQSICLAFSHVTSDFSEISLSIEVDVVLSVSKVNFLFITF